MVADIELALLIAIPTFLMTVGVIWWRTVANDKKRIRKYIDRSGGRILNVRWFPFGSGWMGGGTERFYRVKYEDVDGHEHSAHCKTAFLSGVYFTKDTVTHYREVQVRGSYCSRCGYSLTGSVSSVCLECGQAISDSKSFS